MDELELLALESQALEKEEAERYKPEPEVSEKESEVLSVDALEAAKTRAESLLKVCEGGAKLLLDSRLKLSETELEDGRESLGPLIDKYDLQGEGSGRLPMQEEITAGFYLGRMIKTTIRAVKRLRWADRQKAEAAKDNGKKREHATTQQTHNVSGALGVREESDIAPPFRGS